LDLQRLVFAFNAYFRFFYFLAYSLGGCINGMALLAANVVFFERTSDADEIYWRISTIALMCMLDSDQDIRW